jgi:hypothetical protein
MKHLYCVLVVLLLGAPAHAASLAIDSLSGPVTQNEINSFITCMQSQTPPQAPWGALNSTGHNAWADGTGDRDLEAMGEMGSTRVRRRGFISWNSNDSRRAALRNCEQAKDENFECTNLRSENRHPASRSPISFFKCTGPFVGQRPRP